MSLHFTPEQKQGWLWLLIGAFLLFLLWILGPVFAPFVGAAILAYMLNPAVDWLSARHIMRWQVPRSIATTCMILLLGALLLGIVLVVVPVMQREFLLLREQIPGLLFKLNETLTPRLLKLGIHIKLDLVTFQRLVTEQFSDSGEQIFSTILASLRIGGTAVLGWLATFVLVPVVLFYLLLDWHRLVAQIDHSVPRRWAGKVRALAIEADTLLAQYLRGQLAVMLALTGYYSLSLWAVGLDVALPVGLLTGLLSFIPYAGFGLGIVLALLASLLQYDTLQGVVLVGLVYGVGQLLESFVLTPRLVGERIGLSPLIVIFALLAFGQLFGFVGVLLALPVTAILAVVARHLHSAYLNSPFYQHPE